MLNTVTTRKHLPHTLEENQQTDFGSVRLLKGDPPGRNLVRHYTREVAVLQNNKLYSDQCRETYLMDIMNGNFNTQRDYHGFGGITSDQKFYDPAKVKEYTSIIRFKDPLRFVPAVI